MVYEMKTIKMLPRAPSPTHLFASPQASVMVGAHCMTYVLPVTGLKAVAMAAGWAYRE